MELDDLKNIWKTQSGEMKEPVRTNIVQIKARKSKHPARRFQRKLIIENLIGGILIFIVLLLSALFNSLGIVEIFLLGITIPYLIFATSKAIQVNRLLEYSVNTVIFLDNLLKVIYNYINVNIYSVLILVPFGLYLGYFKGYSIGGEMTLNEAIRQLFERPLFVFISLGIAALFTFLAYKFVKWYYRVLYRREINEIIDLKEELNHSK